jgi:hypothetical protein
VGFSFSGREENNTQVEGLTLSITIKTTKAIFSIEENLKSN